jgi:hypothetical protein
MNKSINRIESNHITTDDLAISAYLKLKGYQLIKCNQSKIKQTFTFNIASEDFDKLRLEFINSDCLYFYNELRNLKKLV